MLGKKIYRGKAGRGQIGAKWQLSEMPTAAQASRAGEAHTGWVSEHFPTSK